MEVVETSFFCPKNVTFSNFKLGRAADTNRAINRLWPKVKVKIACFHLSAWVRFLSDDVVGKFFSKQQVK